MNTRQEVVAAGGADAVAAQLAELLAREHALLARERDARERAEYEAEQLRELLFTTERRLAHRRR